MNRILHFLARYLIGWSVVCGLPLVLLYFARDLVFIRDTSALNTTIASSIALFLGLYITRQLFSFPGTRQGNQGIPAVFAGFAIIAGALLLFRIPYSVGLLAYSLIATAVLMVVRKDLFASTPRNNFHVVPIGEAASLGDIDGVTLVMMERPGLPSDPRASVVADLRANLPAEWERILASAALRGIPVYHYKLLQESIAGKVKIEHLSENTLGSLIPDQAYKEIKWVVDRVAAALLLPILLPFLVIVALVIKLQDGRDVLYRQKRIGLGGKPFTIYKFRSMRPASADEELDGSAASAMTAANDVRITRFGSFIRRYRIDELPQILNILKGEMSFIGPRPEAIPLAEWYERELPFYSYRHIVRPGLTGWAQVNQGHVTDLEDIDHKLQYDFYYVKYFSAWLDILIVLRTARIILTGFGSK
ncbi:sugar transferase [Tsuneonella sp. YG55]|uniref:Sugar transferase n=1 Tax=Tsuneonella litorea TaxID=2976475 RepID=A0A9X2VZ40_9SPHN|nr:sugar transferase [Tsuneonella litorea]MCT2557782.1 sugar transferase [Tsuneonella litorea]